MGLILLPFILIAIIAFILSIILFFTNLKDFTTDNVFIGLVIAALIYLGLFLNYKMSEGVYAFSPYFLFPFFMVILPTSLGFLFRISRVEILKNISLSLIFCGLISGIFILIFRSFTIEIIDYLNLETFH